ncbi:MAG: flagellar hook-length control protein FliK [Candidatus Manganitrophus sp. SB1]|nr:flagellar hook-length control protein FliK [Candidatus Manganitrophus morganii]
MSDLLDLQSINGLAPAAGSQGEKLASKQGESPEGFLKVLNGLAAETRAVGTPNAEGLLASLTEEGHPLLAFLGRSLLDGNQIVRIGVLDEGEEGTEGGASPIDSTLNPPAGLTPLQVGLVQGPPPEGSSSLPLASPGREAQPDGPEQTRGNGPQVRLFSKPDLPIAEAATPGPIVSTDLETEVGIFPEQGGLTGEPAPQGEKELQGTGPFKGTEPVKGTEPIASHDPLRPMTLPEKGLHQKAGENPDRIASSNVRPKGNESSETSFFETEAIGGIEKEKSVLSVLAGGDQNNSEEAGGRTGSERPNPMEMVANETAGMSASDIGPSRLKDDFMKREIGSSNPIQSNITGDTLSGMPEERHLLHQISEKWSLSHFKNEPSFRLQLEPERLGELQIDISMHQEGIVAEIVTKHPFVKELLEGNQELLRGTLAEQGMKIDRFSVSIGDPGQAALGWEDHLRKQGTDAPYYVSQSSLLPAEEGEISPEQRWMKEGAWSAISIYV